MATFFFYLRVGDRRAVRYAMSTLKQTFCDLLARCAVDSRLVMELWQEVENKYSEKNRHYHTLQHLDNMMEQLAPVKDEIGHWDTILFSVYYHDIIYNVLRSDNEEKSIALAEKRLKRISVSNDRIERVKIQILATKHHSLHADQDTNYFTDADLSILGQDWPIYLEYAENVRKEYSWYPDLIYNPGRQKVLKGFLAMGKIYKTNYFYDTFEQQAVHNLQKEYDLLR